MRVTCRTLIPGLIALALCWPCVRAQNAIPPPSKPEVVLTKLGPITYPQIARTARIAGDVEVDLEIQKDGSIESATAVSGPGLLYRAARDSAQQSQFECRNCADTLTTYRLLYTFRLVEPAAVPTCGEPDTCGRTYDAQIAPSIALSGNRVTLTTSALAVCICDGYLKVRSLKCLYLWRCGGRF